MDQEANLHSLIYLISLAIVKLIKTDLNEDCQIPLRIVSFLSQRGKIADEEN